MLPLLRPFVMVFWNTWGLRVGYRWLQSARRQGCSGRNTQRYGQKTERTIGENDTGETTGSSKTTEQPATVAKATETRADRRQEATEGQQTSNRQAADRWPCTCRRWLLDSSAVTQVSKPHVSNLPLIDLHRVSSRSFPFKFADIKSVVVVYNTNFNFTLIE